MLKQRIISFLLIFATVFAMTGFIMPAVEVSASTKATVVNCSSYVNVRKRPSTQSEAVGRALLGARIEVLDTVPAASDDKSTYATWYHITYISNGTTVEGYIASHFVDKDPEEVATDAAFEASIAGFPESYRRRLRSIHASHPTWTFTPVMTNIDWTTALNMESRYGVSLVENTCDRSWKSMASGAYDPATDTFTVVDAPRWVNASRAIIAYYMDPRNSLNESSIFQFLDLNYTVDDSISSATIDQMFVNTFMSSANGAVGYIDGTEHTYAEIFSLAGNLNNINPLFLATRVLQECGSRGSTSSNGATGYYNLYNIGAYSSTLSASMLGLQFAQYGNGEAEFNARYLIPWTTPGLSIVGGSKWICDKYVHAGQNTIYFMRFNFNPASTSAAGTHQYMTATQSAVSEASRIYSAYVRSGAVNGAINFSIPVYNNMPDSCPLPTSENAAYEFVAGSYRLLLAREANSSEISAWSSQLVNGAEAVDILSGLVFSTEFTNKNYSDEDFIRLVYKALTGTDASSGIINEMKGLLNSGLSRKYVYAQLANRDAVVEYINLFGLIPGTYESDDPADTNLSLSSFVTIMYNRFLGRNPEQSGLDAWVAAIRNGQSGPQAAADFFNSSEYLEKNISNEAFVTQLYQTCLGREPDLEGYNQWLNLLNRHYSRDYVLAGFVNSNEFKNLCRRYNVSTANYVPRGEEYVLTPNRQLIGEFVTYLYRSTLGRDPEQAGYDSWVSQIADVGITGEEAAYGFVFSTEMNSKNLSDEDFVHMLYGAFLGREPDREGLDNWIARLNAGDSRHDVFLGFVYSPEFTDLCVRAGFKPYASYRIG